MEPTTAADVSSTQPDPLSSDIHGSTSSSTASSPDHDDDTDLAELLWSKSAVYLHPSPHARDHIPGFLSLVRVRATDAHLVSWVPEALVEGTRDYDAYILVELSSQNERDILVHLAPSFALPDPAESHAFAHPLTSLYSLHVQPPTLTSWVGTITLSLFGGVTLPPLHFHDDESKSTLLDQDRRATALGVGGSHTAQHGHGHGRRGSLAPSWGGEAFLSQLRARARLVRSRLDPSVWLVNPSREDLDAHVGFSSAGGGAEDDAVPAEALQGARARTSILHKSSPVRKGKATATSAVQEWPDDPDAGAGGRDDPGANGGGGGGGMDALTFSVLSGFSRITRGARHISQQAASTVLSHPLAKPLAKHVPKPIAQFALAPGEVSRLTDAAGVGTYDSARVYLAKWARIVAEEGERARRAEFGVDDSSFLEDELGESTGVFDVLARTYRLPTGGGARPRSTRAPRTPVQLEEWRAWMDADGRLLLDEAEAKRRIFQRGLAGDEVRKEVWPFLLRVYPWTSSRADRSKIAEGKSNEYERAKRRWMEDEELQKTERFAEEDHRVEIDCRRTDRTHPLFSSDGVEQPGAHPPTNAHVRACHDVLMSWVFASSAEASEGERNYVQGMSDLFSPLYVVLDGEQWLAFACFEDVMRRHADNFREDQSGMKRQLSELQQLVRVMDRGLYRHLDETGSLNLFFCFRWLLTSFKRELSFDDTVKLWEVLYTDHLGTHFHLFVALAILEANRDVMIRYLREFDEARSPSPLPPSSRLTSERARPQILKYINELSQTLDLATLLADAETLYYTLRAICDSFPAPAAPPGAEGLRQRKAPAAGAGSADERVGAFPPTKEDAEEVRRERVRERTRREVDELRGLLE
ncbi:GTPase activating protein [Rhodotorula kratochvilovae]